MSKETGGNAFPLVRQTHNDETDEVISATQTEPGMTLRDYFAAKILGAIISRGSFLDTDPNMAKSAYRIADAMIEARKHDKA